MRRTIVGATTMTVMAGFALATGATNSASAQANLDAGKSGPQMFALGCSACHRTPQEVAGAGRDFLLEHYTTGPRQADAMATYLDAVSSEPVRAAKPRRTLTTVRRDDGVGLDRQHSRRADAGRQEERTGARADTSAKTGAGASIRAAILRGIANQPKHRPDQHGIEMPSSAAIANDVTTIIRTLQIRLLNTWRSRF